MSEKECEHFRPIAVGWGMTGPGINDLIVSVSGIAREGGAYSSLKVVGGDGNPVTAHVVGFCDKLKSALNRDREIAAVSTDCDENFCHGDPGECPIAKDIAHKFFL